MIMDSLLIFSDRQAITATAVSSYSIDQLAAGEPGHPLFLYIRVHEAFTASGSATLTIDLETDDNSAFSSAAVLWSSGAVAKATLVAGYEIKVPIPRDAQRYLQLRFTVATGPMTAGKLDATIVHNPDALIGRA